MAAAAAASSYLLRPNSLKFKQYFPLHLPPPCLPRLSESIGALTLRSHGSSNKLNVKCFLLPEKRKQSCFYNSNRSSLSSNYDKNPFENIAETIILKALNALKKTAIAAVLLGLLLMYDPNNNKAAWAASGGCMGGDSFSSSSEEETSYSSYSSSESDDDVGVEQKEKKDVTGWGIFWIVVMVGIAVLPTKRTPAHSSTGTRSSVIKLQVSLFLAFHNRLILLVLRCLLCLHY